MENNTPDKDLNEYGFDTSKSRRNLFYTIFATLISIIFVLARQVNIERKATKAAEKETKEIQDDLYKKMFDMVTNELREPKAQIKEATSKVDSAATKVKDVAEKLDVKSRR